MKWEKISARSRFKLAKIKKDFVAWHKENGHSSQRANFISDDIYTLDQLRVTMKTNEKKLTNKKSMRK